QGAQGCDGSPPAQTPPPRWPRTFSNEGNTVLVYQPQIDQWKDHKRIAFRVAIAVTAAGSTEQHFGVAAVQADTIIDDATRKVMLTNLDIAAQFPGLPADRADMLKKVARGCLPSLEYLDVPLDLVLAHLHSDTQVPKVNVSTAPPPIFYSDVPA